MAITVTCPSCGKVMKLKEELIGRKIGCLNPQCDHSFTLKANMAEPEKPAASAKPAAKAPTASKPPVKRPDIPVVVPQSDPGTLADLADAVAGIGRNDPGAPLESQEFRMFADMVDPGKKPLGTKAPMKLHATDSLVDALEGMAGGPDLLAPSEAGEDEPPAKPSRSAAPPPPSRGPSPADKAAGRHAAPGRARVDPANDTGPRAPVARRTADTPTAAVPVVPHHAAPSRVNGESVYLRPLRPQDLVAFEEWTGDSESARTLSCVRLLSSAHGAAAVPCQTDDALLLAVCLKDGGQLIGCTGLFDIDRRNRSARFEILFAESISKIAGKGLRTDAARTMVEYGFGELGLHRQSLRLYENQPAGRRVFELVGFKEEGRQREAYFCEGKYWDTVTWSLLSPEYFERKRAAKAAEGAADAD